MITNKRKGQKMNKYQEALNKIKEDYEETHCQGMGTCYDFEDIKLFQKLVDKATPMKPIKLEIIDLDKIIMPEYTNTIDKYMCDNCGLTWFIVDGHTYQHKYCKQCGQAIDWGKDE